MGESLKAANKPINNKRSMKDPFTKDLSKEKVKIQLNQI